MSASDTASLLSSQDEVQDTDEDEKLDTDEAKKLGKEKENSNQGNEKGNTIQLPICNRNISNTTGGIIITIITVVGQSGMAIALPIFSVAVNSPHCRSNQYFVLIYPALWFPIVFFFICLASKTINSQFSLKSYTAIKVYVTLGLLCAVNCLLVTFASLPNRTPPNLQGVLSITMIPFTVILRYAILRKKIGVRRLLCTLGTLFGLFITLIPNIFHMAKNHNDSKSVVWPLVFILGILPAAISNILQEKEMQRDYRVSLMIEYNIFV